MERDGAGGLRRRELLRDAAAAGAAATVLGPASALAAPRRRRTAGRSVAVLGGGMAGLAAAHELIERGFAVTVLERNALGGKARSIPVPGTAQGGRMPLPGEHGFRFFPGFYHHVPDTMRRIPFPGNEHGVWDNLVAASETVSVRTDGRADGTIFGVAPDPMQVLTPEGLQRVLVEELIKQRGVPPHEMEFFINRLLVFLTSCEERRFGQWEHTSWRDFVRADGKSEEYRKVISAGLTRAVVAAKESMASARTIGNMGEAFIYNIMGRGNDGAPDRVLDLPTNEAWIDPWVLHLQKLGVRFAVGQTVEALRLRGDRVVAARVRDRRGRRRQVEADWFVCAMPAERARRLWSRQVLAADPSLEAMDELFVDWMVGIQFFLRRPVDIVHGHVTFVDSPWALTALTQAQFWPDRDFARDYGDGTAVDCLSVDVSDWDTPGILYGKPAKRCTREEVAREVWAQMKAHLEDTGTSVLPDDILHSWFLDPGVAWVRSRQANRNDTPLLVNTVGSWDKRAKARTGVANLMVAGDHVQTDVDLATMEGANESGRAAVNAILEASGSHADRVPMFRLYDPPEFEALKRLDAVRWRAGEPHALDRP
ncbi:MAG TPA: FAD-dependent oxidoreductase [Baekduia sp.]|nr:FAD-dependent oxidoreductase [Baekduia sp.]